MSKSNLAIFSSGSGTNAEEIMKYFNEHPTVRVKMLLSNNPQAYALERAKKFNVPARVFSKEQFRETNEVVDWLHEAGITHVILAGFMWLIPSRLIKAFPNSMVNIHPALLPKYGGKGMYGMKVHEAIKAAGERETGISIHLVNDNYDEGEVLAQKKVDIAPTDTPEDIANKVHQLEYMHYPAVIEAWLQGNKAI
jgi:phosphoribosylglycinamide formyltransferase-1